MKDIPKYYYEALRLEVCQIEITTIENTTFAIGCNLKGLRNKAIKPLQKRILWSPNCSPINSMVFRMYSIF
jgi:hypothetical protein